MKTDTEIENIENVRVVIRIRPYNEKEKKEIEKNHITIDHPENSISIINDTKESAKFHAKTFTFDYIFSQTATQFDVYQKVVLPIVETVFEGYNGTILAYGQTGSGKTYTMSGNQDRSETKGIIPNTLAHIFDQILKSSPEKLSAVSVTYLEIYNEEVRDLLSNCPNEKLEVRETIDLGVYVEGLEVFQVNSIESITKLLSLGDNNRATRATAMNELSSRSHAILTIKIKTKDTKNDQTIVSKLNLVDLAGSERIDRTSTNNEGFKEATNINQSLFALSNVISALVEGNRCYIAYRNSKLTRLLRDSLGGNSKTVMIATVSPASTDCNETLYTLRYASRTKLIQNRVRLNIQHDSELIQDLQGQIVDLQKQLNAISTNELQCEKPLKVKKIKNFKSNLTEEEIYVRNLKADLLEKLLQFQNDALNRNETEEQQVVLLDEMLRERNSIEESNQVLEEKLEKTTTKNENLKRQSSTLSEQNLKLDLKIHKLEQMISDLETLKFCDLQEQTDRLLKDQRSKEELQQSFNFVDCLIKHTIPPKELQRIESLCYWDDSKLDYRVRGLDLVKTKISNKPLPDSPPQMKNIYKNYPSNIE